MYTAELEYVPAPDEAPLHICGDLAFTISPATSFDLADIREPGGEDPPCPAVLDSRGLPEAAPSRPSRALSDSSNASPPPLGFDEFQSLAPSRDLDDMPETKMQSRDAWNEPPKSSAYDWGADPAARLRPPSRETSPSDNERGARRLAAWDTGGVTPSARSRDSSEQAPLARGVIGGGSPPLTAREERALAAGAEFQEYREPQKRFREVFQGSPRSSAWDSKASREASPASRSLSPVPFYALAPSEHARDASEGRWTGRLPRRESSEERAGVDRSSARPTVAAGAAGSGGAAGQPQSAAGIGAFHDAEAVGPPGDPTGAAHSQGRPDEVLQPFSPGDEGDDESLQSSTARGRCCFVPIRKPKVDATVELEQGGGQSEREADPLAYRMVRFYSDNLPARCPCFCACLGFVLMAAVSGLGIVVHPPIVQTDFSEFMKTDIQVSVLRNAFLYALQFRSDEGRRLQSTALYKNFDLFIAYELRDDAFSQTMLDIRILSDIVQFESNLRSFPEWQQMCQAADPIDQPLCNPGVSFANFALPSFNVSAGDVIPRSLIFDGSGRDPVPFEVTLRFLKQQGFNQVVLPSNFDEQEPALTFLRSAFRFRMLCCTTDDPISVQSQVIRRMRTTWDTFLRQRLVPMLRDAQKGNVEGYQPDVAGQAWPFRVWFQGDDIQAVEMMDALMGDIKMALGSGIFVLVYLSLHTRSPVLSSLGLLLVVLTVPLSYVFCAVLTGSRKFQIASFVSLFLIVGVGSDVLLVYTEFWRQSSDIKSTLRGRMSWTSYHAGRASLASSLSTAISFFSNLTSVIKPLREFGFFMGLCVVLVWGLSALFFLPLCAIDERCCSACRLRCPRRCSSCRARSAPGMGRLECFVGVLHRWRRTCLLLCLALEVAILGSAAPKAQVDTSMPNIFPKDHNQNRGQQILAGFAPPQDVFDASFAAPTQTAQVCRPHSFSSTDTQCSLFWCEGNRPRGDSSATSCQCFRKYKPGDCSRSAVVSVEERFVAKDEAADNPGSPLARSDTTGPIPTFLRAGGWTVSGQLTQKAVAPLLLQEWETGEVALMPMGQVSVQLRRPSNDASCGWQDLCFCSSFTCDPPTGWQAVGGPALAANMRNGSRALQDSSSQQWLVPANLRATVAVVFGMEVTSHSKVLGEVDMDAAWGFQRSYDLRQAWTQRNMASFCSDLPATLQVTGMRCWIQDFRDYVLQQGARFPIASPPLFDEMVQSFWANGLTGLLASKSFLWIRGTSVKASFMEFDIDVSRNAGAAQALRNEALWEEYVSAWNQNAQTTAQGAWHNSDLWVRAEAQKYLVASTAESLIIAVILGFANMFLFTWDLTLSFFVSVATIGVMSGLFFYIVVVMGWAIGPIEIISLMVFIGYADTFPLHIAHFYESPEALDAQVAPGDLTGAVADRFKRVAFSIRSIGPPSVGRATTMGGCAVFLMCCTLGVFNKLGGVVLVVTLLSIGIALVPMPAGLLAVGPVKPGRACACLMQPEELRRKAEETLARAKSASDRVLSLGTGWYEPAFNRGQTPTSPPSLPGALHPERAADGVPPDIGGGRSPRFARHPPSELPGGPAARQASPRRARTPPPHPSGSSGPGDGSARSSGRPFSGQDERGFSRGAAEVERSQRQTEMDFDIGTESPLERIWARDIESNGKVRAVDVGRPQLHRQGTQL